MANIGESHTTRLAWERLKAIKKFIPVRDSVRQKLQAWQQAKTEFKESAKELFKPVTTATETVKTAIVGKPDPVDPTKSKRGLLQAIEGLKKEQEAADAGAGAVTIAKETFINKFTEDGITKIRNIPLTYADELKEFFAWIVLNYHCRQEFLNPGAGEGMTQAQWRDYVYKVHQGISWISKTDDTYNFIKTGVIGVNKALRDQRKKEAEEKKTKIQAKETRMGLKQEQQKQPALLQEEEEEYFSPDGSLPPTPSKEELIILKEELEAKRSELGKERQKLEGMYGRKKEVKTRKKEVEAESKKLLDKINEIEEKFRGGYIGHCYNICPDSVINDISRLEVLLGGKRARNNSPEIINEAAGICQWLFQNKMIDTHIYQELIDSD